MDQVVGVVIDDIAISAGGLWFDSRADQIGHSVAKGSLLQRRFFGAALPWCQPEEVASPFVTFLKI